MPSVDLGGLIVSNGEQMILSSLSPAPLTNCTTFVDMNGGCKFTMQIQIVKLLV